MASSSSSSTLHLSVRAAVMLNRPWHASTADSVAVPCERASQCPGKTMEGTGTWVARLNGGGRKEVKRKFGEWSRRMAEPGEVDGKVSDCKPFAARGKTRFAAKEAEPS